MACGFEAALTPYGVRSDPSRPAVFQQIHGQGELSAGP